MRPCENLNQFSLCLVRTVRNFTPNLIPTGEIYPLWGINRRKTYLMYFKAAPVSNALRFGKTLAASFGVYTGMGHSGTLHLGSRLQHEGAEDMWPPKAL